MSAQLSDRLRARVQECTREQARIVAVLSMQFVLGLAHVPGDARQHCAKVLALLEDPGTTPEQFQVAANAADDADNAAHYNAAHYDAAACYAANTAYTAYAAYYAAACYAANTAHAAGYVTSAAYYAAHYASKTASECDKPALEKFIAQLMLVVG